MESITNIELLSVPNEFKDMFKFFRDKIASLGISIIDDCQALTKEPYNTLLECWTMFQSACYSFKAGAIKVAYFLYNYINTKLKLGLPRLDYTTVKTAYYDPIEEMIVLIGEDYSFKDDTIMINNAKLVKDTVIIN